MMKFYAYSISLLIAIVVVNFFTTYVAIHSFLNNAIKDVEIVLEQEEEGKIKVTVP